MRVNMKQEIINYDGTTVKDQDGALTVRRVISTALNNPTEGEVQSAEEKAKCFEISTRIYSASEVKLTVDQLALIKERVGKIYSPLVYGRICEIIDGEDDAEEPEGDGPVPAASPSPEPENPPQN